MRKTTRALTAGAAVAAVLAAPLAVAAPGKSDPVERHQRQLMKRIDKVSDRLDRAVRPNRIDRLTQSTQDGLKDNVAEDQAELDAIGVTVQAADESFDYRATRKEIKQNRPENYRKVVNVLRKAERLLGRAEAGSDAATALGAVVTEGLTVDDDTPKADLRSLRKDLNAAKDLLPDTDAD